MKTSTISRELNRHAVIVQQITLASSTFGNWVYFASKGVHYWERCVPMVAWNVVIFAFLWFAERCGESWAFCTFRAASPPYPVRIQALREQNEEQSTEPPQKPSRRDFLSISAYMTSLASALLTIPGGGMEANAVVDRLQLDTERPPVARGATPPVPVYDAIVPFSSVRRYKITKLKNGLRVLLVSDRRAYSTSAAVSVGGAGQFADPLDLPGLAHLMEHMILSFNSKSTFRKSRDFQDWLEENDGYSNAFTAYSTVCYHFSCPEAALGEALVRFAGLFREADVETVCCDEPTLAREVRRVDSELDFEDINRQAVYLTKQFVNLEHPYSRFSRGSLDTLETIPEANGIDVGSRLIRFFHEHYLPTEAVLVVIGPQDVSTLERLCAPFSTTFSRFPQAYKRKPKIYPGGFLEGTRYKHLLLYRKTGDAESEKISFQWSLDLDYRDKEILGTQVAFVVSQVLGRRGPGSLYQYLLVRGWVPSGNAGIPRISMPVEVSGFQILKVDINLTVEGTLKRSSVVEAVYDTIATIKERGNYFVSRELIAQCATIAKLHGYFLTPRPPDAIELAIDAQVYGLDGVKGVGSGKWYRFADTPLEIFNLQRAVGSTLLEMRDPNSAVIITTVGDQVLEKSLLGNEPIPLIESPRWQTEPIGGGRFLYEDLIKSTSGIERLVLKRLINQDELIAAVVNPLVPSKIRPPRVARTIGTSAADSSAMVRFQADGYNDRLLQMFSASRRSKLNWILLEPKPGQSGLVLPRGPPEPTCRCAFVLELLSTRPARADVRQAAAAQLWILSFETAVMDLSELGAPGGLAYDLSFNKFGLRLTILGISQTFPSYARRLVRRLADHHFALLRGPEYFPSSITTYAVATASRATNLSPQRKRRIISNLRRCTAHEAAAEGASFLKSCTGAACFAQGDLLQPEITELVEDLRTILEPTLGNSKQSEPAFPDIDDLLYKPSWKPRPSVSCSIPGVPLISDACGRIRR